MRSGLRRRLALIDRELRRVPAGDTLARLSRLTDAELARLEDFALRRAEWPGIDRDWIRSELTGSERLELDALLQAAA